MSSVQVSALQVSTPKIAERILLVEDNDIARQLLSDYLTYRGYHTFSIGDGADFFSALTQFQPHLILLDLKLPHVDGFTLLSQLQQTAKWSSIPVIVLSAFAFQADQQRALQLGAQQYLVKPLRLEQLQQSIDYTLSLAKPEYTLPAAS